MAIVARGQFTISDLNDGADGRGISTITNYYLATASASGVTTATAGWTTTVQTTTTTNKYLWNYVVITYTSGSPTTSTPVIIGTHGATGSTGVGISSVVNYYLVSTLSTGVTTATSGWTTTIQTMTTTNKYLWNYEVINYTSGSPTTTTPVIIGVYGATGSAGSSISSIVEYYLATASASGVTTSTSGWTTTIQTTTTTNKYLWNYEVINYTSGSPTTGTPKIIGTHGATGVGISKVAEEYYLSTSNTTQTGGSWVTIAPTWVTGTYIWTRSVITYTDTSIGYTTPQLDTQYENLSTRVTTAEQKILPGSIKSTVEAQVTANGSTVLATVSNITQTENNWKAAFKAAGTNMIRNSTGKGDIEEWTITGGTLTTTSIPTANLINKECMCLDCGTSTTQVCALSKRFKMQPSTTYTLSGYYYEYDKATSVDIYVLTSTAVDETSTDTSYTSTFQAVNAVATNNTWVKVSYTFTTPASTQSGYVRIDNNGYNSAGTSANAIIMWNSLMLVQGGVECQWCPHPSEIYDGVTMIDADGVTVSHTGVSTKTRMSADGFSVIDSNDEVLAWLSSKKQWTEMNVDKVYASNIQNVYDGASALYVNHSFTGTSDGSSTNPFSSFADLRNYLLATPIINKDITIYIKAPGFEITEQFLLYGLVGSGYISIVYDATVTHRARGNGAIAIRIYQIPKYIMISGGRTGYNSTDGALITDDGGGHGIIISDVQCLYIGYISINCKNWGLVLERTRCYNAYCDFGKCYNAVELRDNSIYYQCDCVGGNTDFCRVKSGSLAFWGDDSNGTRPKGNVIASKGLYYSYGAGRTATDSFRFPTASATPTVPTTSNYNQSFSWTSHKTYAYSYSNWSDTDCKQGSWGYGLRGGHLFFDIAAIKSFLSGTVLDGNTITLTRASSGGLSGAANVYINGSTCSSASGTPGYSNQTLLGTLAWGETKTFTLPKTIVATLKAGTCSSLAVYVNSTAQSNYINITNASINLKVNK